MSARIIRNRLLPLGITSSFVLAIVAGTSFSTDVVAKPTPDKTAAAAQAALAKGQPEKAIELGEAVAETLALALDPFPRSPSAEAALREAGWSAQLIRCPGDAAPQFDSEALWALVQAAHSPIDFDYIGYSKLRWDEYERRAERAIAAAPGLVPYGGGPRSLEIRELGGGFLVVHVLVDCRDAMGANMVNTVAEALGPRVAELAAPSR